MKANLNTNLFSIINVGMYHGQLNPENMFDDYQINEDRANGDIFYNSEYFWNNFNSVAYKKAVESIAKSFLNDKFENNGITITIKGGDLYSPKYYNFSDDGIDLKVTYNKAKILQFAFGNSEQFNQYLKENYSSYDGFTSFTANNYTEWLIDFKNNKDQAIGAVLTYIFNDELSYYQDQFMNNCNTELFYSEFCDCTSYQIECKYILSYVNDNYTTFDFSALIDSYEFETISIIDIEAIVNSEFNRIKNLSVSLF